MIKEALYNKLVHLTTHYNKIETSLSDPEITRDLNKYRTLSKEHAQLRPITTAFKQYEDNQAALEDLQKLIDDADEEISQLAKEEKKQLKEAQAAIESELKILLLPEDPNDQRNIFLEIRAGAGGSEAAIFAGDLLRMYARYVEKKKWRLEIMSAQEAEQGGYKTVVAQISGDCVYSQMKFESGAHRVQRVPETESQGRIHTSTCTVAILPELEAIETVDINPADLRIDTYRASGAGGQHVNKTDSAVRITHLPTQIVVECQDERSQHKNRARAMSLLQAKLTNAEQSKQRQEQAETRRLLVGSGDRSERIRTYNFPQLRVTDHRIGLTLYKLNEIINGGDLDEIIQPLIREHQADLLAASE